MAESTDWLLKPENREEMLRVLMTDEKLPRDRAESNYSFVMPKAVLRRRPE